MKELLLRGNYNWKRKSWISLQYKCMLDPMRKRKIKFRQEKKHRNQWHRHISKISYLHFFHNTNDIFSVPKPNTSLKYSHFKLTPRTTTTITTTSLSNRSHSHFKHNVDGLFPRGNVSTPCLIVKYFRWAMHCHPFRSWICRRIYRLLATYTAVLSMCVRMWTMTRTLSYCCSWTGLMWVPAVILIP